MVTSRRHFVNSIASGLLINTLPLKAFCYPLTRILGDPSPEYNRHYIQRFLKWYSSRWFPFLEKMNRLEKAVFFQWLNLKLQLDYPTSSDFYYESFLIRHHLKGNSQFHGKIYLGHPLWPQKLKNLYFDSFKSRNNLSLPKDLPFENFYGFSKDYDHNTDTVYFLTPKQGVFLKASPTTPNDMGFVEFCQGLEARRGLITPSKGAPKNKKLTLEPSTILSSFSIRDNKGNESIKIRTRSTFLPLLKTGMMSISRQHKKEFHQLPDFLDISKNGLKVYYP